MEKIMKNMLATSALAALLAASTAIPAAQADRDGRGWHGGKHHSHGHRHNNNRHGYWRDGKWITLGIIGGAAIGALADDNCYRTRRGRVVCND
jgi:hypothetical protein